MKLNSLRDLLIDQLRELHQAEQDGIEACLRMREAALSSVLAAAFEEHRRRAVAHTQRLEQVFAMLGEEVGEARGRDKAMLGLLQECLDVIHEDTEPAVRDAVLIALAQRIQHEAIAGYGCVRTWARVVEEDAAARVLQRCLDDAREIDHKLTSIAHDLNPRALAAGRLAGA